MKGVVIFFAVGLLVTPGHSQAQSLGSLAMLGMGGAGGLDLNMQDLLLAQSFGSSGSSSGGSGGTSSGSSGGFDPMNAYLFTQGGFGGGEMSLPIMASLMADRGGRQGGASMAPASIGGRIARMLGDSGSGISPTLQDNLWTMIQSGSNMQRILDAISSVNDRMQLQRDGLPGINPMIQAMACPPPRHCMAFCETPEKSFTPESFFVCPGCPTCSGGAGLFSSLLQRGRGRNLAGMGGSSSSGMDLAQNMYFMQALQSGQMNPAMMALLLSPESQTPTQPEAPQQLPQLPRQSQFPQLPSLPQLPTGMVMPPPGYPVRPLPGGIPNIAPPGFTFPGAQGSQGPSSSTESKPSPTSAPSGTPNVPSVIPPGVEPTAVAPVRPPPQFLEAMRQLGQSMSQQRKTINNPSAGP